MTKFQKTLRITDLLCTIDRIKNDLAYVEAGLRELAQSEPRVLPFQRSKYEPADTP